MFIPFEFESVNKASLFHGKELAGNCIEYVFDESRSSALFFEYVDTSSNQVVACDVLVSKDGKDYFAHDYVLLKDNQWRNSYGQVSRELLDLVPGFLLEALEVSSSNIKPFLVEA